MKSQQEAADKTPAVDFSRVYREELDWVAARRSDLRSRGKLPNPSLEIDTSERALDTANIHSNLQDRALAVDLCGLAISGGGIRSATFAIGVLQGLAVVGLLPRFDYLSTVSGGGYIGSWLSAWIRRAGFDTVEKQLAPPRYRTSPLDCPSATQENPSSQIDSAPLRHVRQYSNYLAPKPGLFSFDGWVLIAIYLRNLLLNQCVLILAALGLFVGVRCVVELFTCCYAIWFRNGGVTNHVFAGLTLITLVSAALLTGTESAKTGTETGDSQRSLSRFWSKAVLPWLLAALLTTLFVLTPLANDWIHLKSSLIWLILGSAILHGCLGASTMSEPLNGGFYGLIAGGLAGLLLCSAFRVLLECNPTVAPVAVLGVPICLGVFVLANFLHTGLCGSSISELEREWWSSLNSRMMMCGCAWLVVFAVSIYGPWILGRLLFVRSAQSTFAGQLTAVLGTGWIGAVLSGLWAAKSPSSGGSQSKAIDIVARFAPAAFLVSLFLAVSLATTWIAYDVYAVGWKIKDGRFHQRAANVLTDLDFEKRVDTSTAETASPSASPSASSPSADKDEAPKLPLVLTVLTLTGLASVLLLSVSHWVGSRIGVNTFSLQNLYANRLVRCYLGASRPANTRTPHPIVNLDPDDNLAISDLFPGPISRDEPMPSDCWGPIHIINGALNRKAGSSSKKDAAARAESLMFLDRQAESFVFTPLYCGSDSTKYCQSTKFAGDVKIGTAVAVSGAAVSPNMGYHSSAAVTALLTLFNIRMGAWFGNPSSPERRNDANPPASWWTLLKELAGATDADDHEIYVSDGGHFENVGVYELIRRRCRFIMAVEAGADPQFHENVGRIVRQARMDFGVRIELDCDLFSPNDSGNSKQHLIVGRIHYGDVHTPLQEQEPGDSSFSYANNQGIIVWIKNSVTGDEPGDLKNHRAMHPEFPYDTTADQFFNESQFESYRELGLHAVQTMLTKAKPRATRDDADPKRRVLARAFASRTLKNESSQLDELSTRDLFELLFDSWSPQKQKQAKRAKKKRKSPRNEKKKSEN